ncbi:GAK5 protein, partial [Catharus fuscescens]|nr:GAK5 protein [Catharus fuscescens]
MSIALETIRGSSEPAEVCYGYGKPGHFKRDCLALKGDKSKALTLCSRCRKGLHLANKCHFKYDSEGCLIQGNWSQSVGWCSRALIQIPRLPPQMPLQVPPPQVSEAASPQVFT